MIIKRETSRTASVIANSEAYMIENNPQGGVTLSFVDADTRHLFSVVLAANEVSTFFKHVETFKSAL